MVCPEQRWVMLWPWQTLEEVLQKMQRCSEFIAFHGITLAGYTVCGFRSSSTKFTASGRTLAGRAQGVQYQLRPPLFSQLSSSAFRAEAVNRWFSRQHFKATKAAISTIKALISPSIMAQAGSRFDPRDVTCLALLAGVQTAWLARDACSVFHDRG